MSLPAHIPDAVRAFWILVVFLLTFFWLPNFLFSRRQNSSTTLRLAGNFVRTVLIVTFASLLLASLRIMNITTVSLLFLSGILVGWVRKRAGRSRNWFAGLQETTIGFVRDFEGQAIFYGNNSPANLLNRRQWLKALQGREMLVAAFAAVLIVILGLHFEHAVRELRLDQPDQYVVLLRGRELALNIQAFSRPLIFPSVIATTALLSSTDPMQVTRFLCPILGLFIIFAAGLVIRVCARGGLACVAVIYLLGTGAFESVGNDTTVPISTMEKLESVFRISPTLTRASPEFEVGVLCLLLALAFLADWYKNSRGWDSLFDVACCLVLAGLVSQFLLIVSVIVAGAVLLWPVIGLVAVVLIPFGLAACSTLFTDFVVPNEVPLLLPLAAALGLGCFLALAESRLTALMGEAAQSVLLIVSLIIAIFWFRPHPLATQYLEYEEAARETQEIAYRFPLQSWVIAAPTEQLAETLGLGWHEDLAEFVEKYQSQASSPRFRFPDTDLFVYVEKRPFQIFATEPASVPMQVLADTTYRNYRSPAGRASLESAALQLCESYRQSHSDADVFFEDEDLRIYHFRPQRVLNSRAGG
jgi:hypothetical protein